MMNKRLQTAIPGLDAVLDGGFLYHNSILLKGEPGAGKTTLGMQLILNGIERCGENGIIVLFEQFPQQLYRDAASFNWDLPRLVAEKKLGVLFLPAGDIHGAKNMEESPLISKIAELALELDAKRILVDGMTHFIKLARREADERDVFLRFLNAVKSLGLTPILTAEGGREQQRETGFEEFLADCVIQLSSSFGRETTFVTRELEVRKTRGHQHLRGRHPYYITAGGIELYPKLPPAPEQAPAAAAGSLEKAPSGVAGLDAMLRGGLTRGTSTILAGMPGSFKTTLGAQFIAHGAQAGEAGLIVSLNESPEFLVRTMAARGIRLSPGLEAGLIAIEHYVPKNFYIEELLHKLERNVEQKNIRRLLLDGISGVNQGIADPATWNESFRRLLAILNRRGVTSLHVQKLEKFTASQPLSDVQSAEIADGVIYTGTIEIESALRHVISILKMRGGSFISDLREMTCGEEGLRIGEKWIGVSGILGGNPRGRRKKSIEDFLQPLYFIRDFLTLAGDPGTPPEQRTALTNNMNNEARKVIERLREYFDIRDDEQ